MGKGTPKLETVPQDARYHNQNCTNWCMDSFLDYHRCTRLLGAENKCCDQFKKIYQSICPNAWIKRWEEQMKKGNFPYDLPCKEDCGD